MGEAPGGNQGDAFFGSIELSAKQLSEGEASLRRRHRWRQGIDDDGYHWNSHVGIEKMQRQHGGVVEEEFVGERWIKTAIETGSE
jgi:hypothetical protein